MNKRTRRNYTEGFKRDAVRLITEEGYSISEAARNLGLNPKNLGRWKAEYTGKENWKGAINSTDKEELKRLRKENRRLQMERDILKKATAFFARESL